MGGLGPGIGGLEYIVIAAVALIVLGPERLPTMLRRIGQWVAKARGMANEFRASFDELARQSELDDLRKEVEALRQGQGSVGQSMVRLGAEADAAFKEIKSDLNTPALAAPPPALALDQPEFPEPIMAPLAAADAAVAESENAPPAKPKRTVRPHVAETATLALAKPRARRNPATDALAAAAPTTARKPRKPKTDL